MATTPSSTKSKTPLPQTANDFNLVIVDPDKIIWEGKAKRLIAPAIIQDIAILPNHTPLYAQLRKGIVITDPVNEAPQQIPIDGGVIRVKSNNVSIIVGFEAKDEALPPTPPAKT